MLDLIPSTARSGSSAAAPLPEQLEPLLGESFEAAKNALAKVLPNFKKPNILEEAEFEDEGDGSFEREKLAQCESLPRIRHQVFSDLTATYVSFRDTANIPTKDAHLRGARDGPIVYRGRNPPSSGRISRTVVGPRKPGQRLDSGEFTSRLTRRSCTFTFPDMLRQTLEAACVQLFVEAKRHKPSIIFIPSLSTWCGAVTDTVKSTVKGLLDGLDPSDPILLLAVVDGPIGDLPADVRSWFGFVKANRLALARPDEVRHGLGLRQRFRWLKLLFSQVQTTRLLRQCPGKPQAPS